MTDPQIYPYEEGLESKCRSNGKKGLQQEQGTIAISDQDCQVR